MNTLMHLPGDGLCAALRAAPGDPTCGVLEVGVWGADENREWTYLTAAISSRTDDDLRAMLSAVGHVTEFATWSRFEDGGHYQWARIVVG